MRKATGERAEGKAKAKARANATSGEPDQEAAEVDEADEVDTEDVPQESAIVESTMPYGQTVFCVNCKQWVNYQRCRVISKKSGSQQTHTCRCNPQLGATIGISTICRCRAAGGCPYRGAA